LQPRAEAKDPAPPPTIAARGEVPGGEPSAPRTASSRSSVRRRALVIGGTAALAAAVITPFAVARLHRRAAVPAAVPAVIAPAPVTSSPILPSPSPASPSLPSPSAAAPVTAPAAEAPANKHLPAPAHLHHDGKSKGGKPNLLKGDLERDFGVKVKAR
jgi:hypothetical protein